METTPTRAAEPQSRAVPETPEALNEYGITLARAGQYLDAENAFRQALRLRPAYANALNNLSNVLRRLQRLDEAEVTLLRALVFQPKDVELYLQIGQFWRLQGRLGEALGAYTTAADLAPGNVDVLGWMGALLLELNRPAEAIIVLQEAIRLQSGNARLQSVLGQAYRQRGDNAAAEAPLRAAVRLAPDDAELHGNLAALLAELGLTQEALHHAHCACTLKAQPAAQILAASVQPVIHESLEQLTAWRERLEREVDRLIDSGVRIDPTSESIQHFFYLAYHGRNNGALMTKLSRLGEGPRAWTAPPLRPPQGTRIRIGFLSRHLQEHTIGLLNQGLIKRLDRRRFEVIVLQIGGPTDTLGQTIARSADRCVVLQPPVGRILPALAAEQLDVLYFTDIGMEPLSYTIGFSRLAPVQCLTWGHPETSGLPTIDYFLSSQDLEVPEGQDHYREQLVRLPRLGVWYEQPRLSGPVRRSEFGLPPGKTLYGCPQSLFKIHPEFDVMVRGILEADPAGVVVMLEGSNPYWRQLLMARWQRTLGRVVDRICWTPRVPRDRFWRLNACFDLLLDPIHFGGGNTTYEALALGQPVVTLPSPFLRARLTYAMYRQMALLETVTTSADEYVAKAVQLGRDAAYRQHVKEQTLARVPVLFHDDEAVRAVESFLEQAVTRRWSK